MGDADELQHDAKAPRLLSKPEQEDESVGPVSFIIMFSCVPSYFMLVVKAAA